MESMIVSTANGYPQHFCVACADDHPDIAAQLGKHLDAVAVDELVVLGETCGGCGRPIRDVPASTHLYLLKLELRIALTIEVPAHCALEARLLLHKALPTKKLLQRIQEEVGAALAEGDVLSDQGTLTSHLAEPQVLPPPQTAWITTLPDAPFRSASPPTTLLDCIDQVFLQPPSSASE